MNDRYALPDPKCDHVRKGRVQAGDLEGAPHASTSVCDREECIEDAMAWAYASTHLQPVHIPDPPEVQARIAAQNRRGRG